jgi:nucleoside-diphosphate-sugar epimerase
MGAAGALGRPLSARLRSDGHRVFGIHRSPEGARVLESLGCVSLPVDVFDEIDRHARPRPDDDDVPDAKGVGRDVISEEKGCFEVLQRPRTIPRP